VEVVWVAVLAESLEGALRLLCQMARPLRLCDDFRVERRGERAFIVGSKAAGVAVKRGDGHRAVLLTDGRLYVITYAPSDKSVVSGELCASVERVARGECPRLKYEVWCRHCVSANGRRYRRCWAETEAKSEEVKRALQRLDLSDIGEDKLDSVVGALSSICQ